MTLHLKTLFEYRSSRGMNAAVFFLLVLISTGCSRILDPSPKKNDFPHTQHSLEMTLSREIGELTVTAEAVYGVKNEIDCLPVNYTKFPSGIRVDDRQEVPIPVKANSSTNYFFKVNRDHFSSNKEYFWKEPCNWDLEATGFRLKFDGMDRSAFIDGNAILQGESRTLYCWLEPTVKYDGCILAQPKKYLGNEENYLVLTLKSTK